MTVYFRRNLRGFDPSNAVYFARQFYKVNRKQLKKRQKETFFISQDAKTGQR